MKRRNEPAAVRFLLTAESWRRAQGGRLRGSLERPYQIDIEKPRVASLLTTGFVIEPMLQVWDFAKFKSKNS